MNANIVVKLNDGRSYVYGNVDIHDDITIGHRQLWIGGAAVPMKALEPSDRYELDQVKEILIKPMPLLESIAHSVLGLHRHD